MASKPGELNHVPTLVTRNLRDIDRAGVACLDPFAGDEVTR
jgi:hypothetical protein